MPERAPLGQLPRSVDVILDGDLVDLVKPGDRVAISGVFRALAGRVNGSGSGKFKTVVLGNHVRLLKQQVASTPMTPSDIRNIRALAKRDDVFGETGARFPPPGDARPPLPPAPLPPPRSSPPQTSSPGRWLPASTATASSSAR